MRNSDVLFFRSLGKRNKNILNIGGAVCTHRNTHISTYLHMYIKPLEYVKHDTRCFMLFKSESFKKNHTPIFRVGSGGMWCSEKALQSTVDMNRNPADVGASYQLPPISNICFSHCVSQLSLIKIKCLRKLP
jgi:hypothetical protein